MQDRAKNAAIIKRMREASIPQFTFKTTLELEGQEALRQLVMNKEYQTEDGYDKFVIHAGRADYGTEVAHAVAVLAKELVLTGVPTYHTSVTALAREIKYEWHPTRTDESPVLARRGKGVIVIPDFDHHGSIEPLVWEDTLDWLVSHSNNGGGLILGQSLWVAATPVGYGATFSSFARGLREIRIKV